MTEEGELSCIVFVYQVQTCTCVMRTLTRENHHIREEIQGMVWGLPDPSIRVRTKLLSLECKQGNQC